MLVSTLLVLGQFYYLLSLSHVHQRLLPWSVLSGCVLVSSCEFDRFQYSLPEFLNRPSASLLASSNNHCSWTAFRIRMLVGYHILLPSGSYTWICSEWNLSWLIVIRRGVISCSQSLLCRWILQSRLLQSVQGTVNLHLLIDRLLLIHEPSCLSYMLSNNDQFFWSDSN